MDRRALREEFKRHHGYWGPAWQNLLDADPEFFHAYLEFSLVPSHHSALDPKIREFVALAVDAAVTHLHEPGLRRHVRRAVEHGATRAELLEVLQLTATLGIHAANTGVPLLLDVLKDRGMRDKPAPLSARQHELRAHFERNRGYWNAFWDGVLELDPDFFEAYLNFSSFPWRKGSLEPKVKEFIYIAFDASATHMFQPGLKLHIENALDHGATVSEIMEIFEIASTIGIETCTTGLPIIDEELHGERSRD